MFMCNLRDDLFQRLFENITDFQDQGQSEGHTSATNQGTSEKRLMPALNVGPSHSPTSLTRDAAFIALV